MQFKPDQWDHVKDGVAYPTSNPFPISRGPGPGSDAHTAMAARQAWMFQTAVAWLPVAICVVWLCKNRRAEMKAGIGVCLFVSIAAALLFSREIERAYNEKLDKLGVRSNFNLFVSDDNE